MKRNLISLLMAGVLLLSFGQQRLEARAAQQSGSTISVGATPVPHAELLNLIRSDLAALAELKKSLRSSINI